MSHSSLEQILLAVLTLQRSCGRAYSPISGIKSAALRMIGPIAANSGRILMDVG
jgi:hypothetical protein